MEKQEEKESEGGLMKGVGSFAKNAWTEKAMQKAQSYLRVLREKADPTRGLTAVPKQMHTSARQLELLIELVEDFKEGRYRDIGWTSLAVMSGAVAYVLSPADVLPEAILGLGLLDDAIVLSIAMHLVRGELEKFCVFKGHDVEDYFPPARPAARSIANATHAA
jgi:uncharacterized membrane protein YkvA (DUF1232 family)